MSSRRWFWPGLLSGLVLAVYARTASFDFLYCDDNRYVYENPHVRGGVTWEGLKWAFGSRDDNYWHPLSFVSHMADVSLAGAGPVWPHAENALLHLACVLLLYLFLERATGQAGPSAFVAAVFAIHPVQNETVAWIAERKSLLSALFCLLALRAYAARRRGWTAVFFALSLLCKPASAGLPLLLLALDLWPLGRREPLAAKAPLFALSLASCVVSRLTAVKVSAVPWALKLSNVAVSHVQYLRTVLWPAGLEVFYRYPARPAPAAVLAASVLLFAGLTRLAWRERRRRPALLAGWAWFLLLLEPSAGWVALGSHARADRFLYLPLAGLAVAAAWGLPASWARRGRPALAGAVVLALTLVSLIRLGDWRDSSALFSRALAVDESSGLMHTGLGFILIKQGKLEDAVVELRRAVELEPRMAEAHNYLGIALAAQGKAPEAAAEFKDALALDPQMPFARQNLAAVMAASSQVDRKKERPSRGRVVK